MAKRNIDKRMTAAEVEANIVAFMRKRQCGWRNPLSASSIGEAGFPGYNFRNAQGAALAVARILRDMVERGVLAPSTGAHGYYLTEMRKQ